MSRFEYLEARSLRQALSLLDRHGEEARIVAGATDFLIRWRQGTWNPGYVVNIKRIPGLDRVSYSRRTGLRLGALATLRALETHPLIRQHYPGLSAAATTFAGVQVRNLATVGGNVCNASPAGDTLPALLALGAQCKIVGPGGERWLPLDQFFVGPGRSALKQGEILTELHLPPPPPKHRLSLHQGQPSQCHGHSSRGSSFSGLPGPYRTGLQGGQDRSRRGGPHTLRGQSRRGGPGGQAGNAGNHR